MKSLAVAASVVALLPVTATPARVRHVNSVLSDNPRIISPYGIGVVTALVSAVGSRLFFEK